jgi:hypothetical protein
MIFCIRIDIFRSVRIVLQGRQRPDQIRAGGEHEYRGPLAIALQALLASTQVVEIKSRTTGAACTASCPVIRWGTRDV